MRLIDADALLKRVFPVTGVYDDSCDFDAVGVGYIKGAPTVDPVAHGRWLRVESDYLTRELFKKCSVCYGGSISPHRGELLIHPQLFAPLSSG